MRSRSAASDCSLIAASRAAAARLVSAGLRQRAVEAVLVRIAREPVRIAIPRFDRLLLRALQEARAEEPECERTTHEERRMLAREAFHVTRECIDVARLEQVRQALGTVRGTRQERAELVALSAQLAAAAAQCVGKRADAVGNAASLPVGT